MMKPLLKETLYNSLAQAILRLILTPYLPLKFFLSMCVLASSSMASYLVIRSLIGYFNYDVSTTSRTIFETSNLFPKVTFCNVNWLTTQYAFDLTQAQTKWSEFARLSNEEKKMLGHNLSDILFECTFNNNPCNSSHFHWSFDVNYGNCYTFNSGFDSNGNKVDLERSSISGHDLGLQIRFYVNIYEELLNSSNNLNGLGAVFRIGNSSYLSGHLNGGIFVPSGFQTYIAVDREFKIMLSRPYSNCEIDYNSPTFRPDSDLYNLIGQSDYAYSQQLCFAQCLQKKFIEAHNCTSYHLISLYNKTQCDSDIEDIIFESSDSFDNNYINKICLPQCPLECNQTLYKTSMSFFQLNGNSYVWDILNSPQLSSHFINRSIDANTARESFLYVNVFYENLAYMSTSELAQMNAVSLFASIGGNMSLFLGVSVFSLCEIVEVAIEIYFIVKTRNKKIKETSF